MKNHDDGNISTRQSKSKKLRKKTDNNKKKRKIDVMNNKTTTTTTTTIIKGLKQNDTNKKRNEENDTIAFVIKGQLTPIKPLVQKNVVKRLQKKSCRRNIKPIIMASSATNTDDKSLQENSHSMETSSKIEAVEADDDDVKIEAKKSSSSSNNKKNIKRKSSVNKLRNQDLDLSIQRIIKKYAKKFNIKRVNTKEKPTRKKKDDKRNKSSLTNNSRHHHSKVSTTTNKDSISLKKSQSLSAIKIKEERIDEDFLTTSIKQEPNINENEEKNNESTNKVLSEIKPDPINEDDDDDHDDLAKKELEKKKINAQKLRLLKKKSLVSKEAQKQMDDKRRAKLLQFWNSPKRRRVASLNASAKVHCLYENESKSTINRITEHAIIKTESLLMKKNNSTKSDNNNSEEISSDPDSDSSEQNSDQQQQQPIRKSLRNLPGLRAIGKHWEDDTMSSDDSEIIIPPSSMRSSRIKKEIVKKPEKLNNEQQQQQQQRYQKKCTKRKPKQEVYMDLKDMVVKKRMASLNASAILAASYSTDKKIKSNNNSRSSDSSNYDTDSSAEEYFAAIQQIDLTKNANSNNNKRDIIKQETDDGNLIEVHHPNPNNNNNNVAVILNQDTDVTITGVYVNSTTRSTHHEGFCSIAGMQYRISATSHTQTAATTVSTETLLQSGSSSDNNAHSDVQSCSSKSYTPLDALSNMQPPPGPGIHGHPGIPCQPIPQMASPSSHLHRAAAAGPSAFSSPHHHSAQSASASSGYGLKTAPASSSEESPSASTTGFIPGYYQPAGPLISVSHHGLHPPPLSKSVPLSDVSPTNSINSSSVQHHAAPAAPSSNNGDSSDNEVIITSVTAGTKEPALISSAPPLSSSSSIHHPPPPPPPPSYRYPPQYPQYHHSYPCPSQYHYQTPPPPPTPPYPPSSHDLMCYTPTSNYLRHAPIKFAPSSNSSPFHRYSYYPPPLPHAGHHTELYARQNLPPTQQSGGGQQQQQLVSTAPVTVSGNYSPQSVVGPSIMETYPPSPSVVAPPTLVDAFQPASHYYSPTAYGIPAPPCYSHSPSRAISYINASYQHCPCPLNTCPKNGHTGPLTGEVISKRSNISKDSKPLPPVALAIPLESVSGIGPPSPARGSAGMPSGGMPPPPSPAGANYQQQQPPPPSSSSSSSSSVPKQELIRIDDEQNKVEKRKARVGKANVRNTMQQNNMPTTTNMLLMLNPTQEFVKREIHSPKNEKELIELQHLKSIIEESSDTETLKKENIIIKSTIIEKEIVENQKSELESKEEIDEPLPPCTATVAENVKVKNMKRKQSQCKENAVLTAPPVKKKKITSYKDFIRKHTSCFKMNIGKKKLVSRTAKVQLSNNNNNNNNNKMKVKTSNKKKLNVSKERTNNQRIKNKKNNNKKFLKRSTQILNNLIATKNNNIDRVIDDVINNSSIQREEEETCLNDNNIKKTNNNNNNNVIKNKQNKITKVNNRRKSTINGKTKTDNNNSLQDVKNVKKLNITPKWSNGWIWEGESYESKVFINSDEVTMIRRCYPSMRHKEGDLIQPGDCVLLKAGPRKNDLPYVAKIAALWENPDDGEMMMSLLWYYRPEHTEQGRVVSVDQPDEVFASRHKDSNSVACIDDKCYVLTFNEYCRYKKTYRGIEEGLNEVHIRNVPLPVPYPRFEQQPPLNNISPDMVFFCRKVYDFRQKRIIKNPT